MSGFLHRIAASAIRPQPRVYPLVQRTFSPAPLEEISTSAVPAPINRVAPVESSAPSLTATQPQASAESPFEVAPLLPRQRPAEHVATSPSVPPTPATATASHDPAPATRDPFQPLLPLATQTAQATSPPPSTPFAAPQRAAHPAAPPPPERAPHAVPTSTWDFQPLVAEKLPDRSATAAEPRRELVAKSESPVASPRSSPGRISPPAAPVQRVPPPRTEDIQIHIGRVEVIAMPPPAPREPRPPARKSQTLDEYLRRSNGRTG